MEYFLSMMLFSGFIFFKFLSEKLNNLDRLIDKAVATTKQKFDDIENDNIQLSSADITTQISLNLN